MGRERDVEGCAGGLGERLIEVILRRGGIDAQADDAIQHRRVGCLVGAEHPRRADPTRPRTVEIEVGLHADALELAGVGPRGGRHFRASESRPSRNRRSRLAIVSRIERLDRAADHDPVEEAPPPGSRLVLDRDPVRELAVGLVEVATVPRVGQAALLAGVLDQPIRLDSHELHLELHLAPEHPEDEGGSVARLTPALRRSDPDEARPVLAPVRGIGDVVEPVADGNRKTVLNFDPDRSRHGEPRARGHALGSRG
jgi:hypothetical protein